MHFSDNLLDLQQQQPHLYESLTKNLNAEEQSIIQAVVQNADNVALQAEAQAHAAAQTAQVAATQAQSNGQSPATAAPQ